MHGVAAMAMPHAQRARHETMNVHLWSVREPIQGWQADRQTDRQYKLTHRQRKSNSNKCENNTRLLIILLSFVCGDAVAHTAHSNPFLSHLPVKCENETCQFVNRLSSSKRHNKFVMQIYNTQSGGENCQLMMTAIGVSVNVLVGVRSSGGGHRRFCFPFFSMENWMEKTVALNFVCHSCQQQFIDKQ